MFNTAVLLDLSISAVMIGKQQSISRNQLSGTATAEKDYSILQGCLVDAVDVFCTESESLCLHVSDPL